MTALYLNVRVKEIGKKGGEVLMRRIFMLLTVVALMVAMVVIGAMPAFAETNPGNNGKAANAPGQIIADNNCENTFNRQRADGNTSNGHKDPDNPWPTNCDHFYQGF